MQGFAELTRPAPEQDTPLPAAGWGYHQCHWDPDVSVYPPYGGPFPEPPFAEDLEIIQCLLQIPVSESVPKPLLEQLPDQRVVGHPEF